MAQRRLDILYKIITCLFEKRTVDDSASAVLELTAAAVAAESAVLILRQPAPGVEDTVHTFNLPREAFRPKPIASELLLGLGLQGDNPIIIGDYPRYVFAHAALVALGVKRLLAAAIPAGPSTAGLLLMIDTSGAGVFQDQDARFLQAAARLLSLSLENTRLGQLGRLFPDEVETVQRAGTALTASLDLPKVLDSILATAHDLVPADLAHIFLYSEGKLTFGAASGAGRRWDKPYAEPRQDGLTYRVARTGEPLLVTDLKHDPLYRGSPNSWHGTIAGFPLKVKERVVGVMNISRDERKPFREEELRILQMLASQAATAVENAHLYQTERTQRQRIEALRSAVATLSQSLELPEVLDRILTELRKVIPYDSASVMLKEADHLTVVAGRDLPGRLLFGQRFPLTEIEREIERTGQPFILADASTDERFHGWGETRYVRGWMSVPLLGKAGMIGCLTIDSRRAGAYSREEGDLAMSFAQQAAVAVENAQLHQSLKDQLKALKASQAKLVQSEKMAAIGKLVAGVAHELNNPLTGIIGIAQLLQSGEVSDPVRQDLDKLVGEAHRAGKIVRSLLDFSRQQRPERQPVHMNEVVSDTLRMLAYELKSREIVLHTRLAEDLPQTMADAHQLQQVLVNLINNAYEAMYESKRGGNLVVSTELAAAPGAGGAAPTRREIRLRIEDDGPGIPPEDLPQIFDPFFTTKSPGKGTGLGLSVCHGIINEHGGQIWVEKSSHQGTSFCLQIPVVPLELGAEVAADTNERGPDLPAQHGSTRILVVEDEQVLRNLMVRVLDQAGYQVEHCPDGLEALERIGKLNFDLVICDVRMPRLSGIELYRRLKDCDHPAAGRIMFITGDTVSEETQGFIEGNCLPHMGKPFEIRDLLLRVRRELER